MKKIIEAKNTKKMRQSTDDSWKYGDDCAICQAMKRWDSVNKPVPAKVLVAAFEKQNQKTRDFKNK